MSRQRESPLSQLSASKTSVSLPKDPSERLTSHNIQGKEPRQDPHTVNWWVTLLVIYKESCQLPVLHSQRASCTG